MFCVHEEIFILLRQLGFKNVYSLIISPDGPLHFLPFEILYDGHKLLLEQYKMQYSTNARDFLRLRNDQGVITLDQPIVFGNPAFVMDEPVIAEPVAPNVDPNQSKKYGDFD